MLHTPYFSFIREKSSEMSKISFFNKKLMLIKYRTFEIYFKNNI